ncbi:MAG: hypothetical protein V8Q36_08910 [Anaerotignum sp.]
MTAKIGDSGEKRKKEASVMIHIRVPATSANMGPGFDSIGVALQVV